MATWSPPGPGLPLEPTVRLPASEDHDGWRNSRWGTILLWGLLALIPLQVIAMTGVSGGPNHGEHPMIISVLLLLAFLYFSPLWPPAYWWAFLLLTVAAVVLGVMVMGIRIWSEPGKVWVARAAYALIFAGMVWVMVAEKPPTTRAEWSSRSSIHLRVTPSDSVAVRLLDADGEALWAAGPWEPTVAHALVFWTDEPSPHAVEVAFPGGRTEVRELPERPGG